MTVAENVDLPLAHRGLLESKRKARVRDSLDRVGMWTRANHDPSQISGGQQQRVAVARAIIGRPMLLLADEPTGNLDSKNGELIMRLLRQLHDEGVTICIVTHDSRCESEAEGVIQLVDGNICDELT